MEAKLFYAHDPMCSWCYAFRPVFEAFISNLPDEVELIYLLGGLAPDTQEPMPDEMREFIQANWRRIEAQVPNTKFNYDFWQLCQPRRNTYPACRAVIAARQQGAEYDIEMISAIQQAYYCQARNPSELSVLTQLAIEIGLDENKFATDLGSSKINIMLQNEINQARDFGLNSFPSLLLALTDQKIRLDVDYLDEKNMLDQVNCYFY